MGDGIDYDGCFWWRKNDQYSGKKEGENANLKFGGSPLDAGDVDGIECDDNADDDGADDGDGDGGT